MERGKYTYGPVLSRRLGKSLGVDLFPRKICSMDCLYCQLGPTVELTLTRAEYVPTGDVLQEIEERLGTCGPLDYVTLSGSGEPTLHTGFAEIIDAVKKIGGPRVAITTNASLMSDPEVREGCRAADLVLPSLDVADGRMFRCVNRPHKALDFDEMLQGLIEFRRQYAGQIWLEVLLLYGVTGIPAYVRLMRPVVDKIRADRIQLNTAVRSPKGSLARAVPDGELAELAPLLGPRTEVITYFTRRKQRE